MTLRRAREACVARVAEAELCTCCAGLERGHARMHRASSSSAAGEKTGRTSLLRPPSPIWCPRAAHQVPARPQPQICGAGRSGPCASPCAGEHPQRI